MYCSSVAGTECALITDPGISVVALSSVNLRQHDEGGSILFGLTYAICAAQKLHTFGVRVYWGHQPMSPPKYSC